MNTLDVIIPVYNEDLETVRTTLEDIRSNLHGRQGVSLYVVDDGSDEDYGLNTLKDMPGVVYIRHEHNRGYGSALKTGILSGSGRWIAITDADGTYPVSELPKLLEGMESADTVIGIRTGPINQTPVLRRCAKYILNRFAGYMAGRPVKDINSGLRVFSRDFCYYLWGLYPNGFSFTSTSTMGALLGGFRVKEVPISYYRRIGASSIRPLYDTRRFFSLIFRLGLLFAPMKVFGPVAALLFMVGAVKGLLRDYLLLGYVGNFSIMFMLAGIQILMMGALAELIVSSRKLTIDREDMKS